MNKFLFKKLLINRNAHHAQAGYSDIQVIFGIFVVAVLVSAVYACNGCVKDFKDRGNPYVEVPEDYDPNALPEDYNPYENEYDKNRR
jgi:hypothetical protein